MISRRLVLALYVAVLGGTPEVALADTGAASASTPLSRFTMSGTIGYAYPVGNAETGTEMRDVSFGLAPLSLGATYDLPRGWNASTRLAYGVNIPTLCSSGPDCESSLGHDVIVAVGVGRTLPSW